MLRIYPHEIKIAPITECMLHVLEKCSQLDGPSCGLLNRNNLSNENREKGRKLFAFEADI